jgi:ABC-type oligopeptide transport system substrate-binding subunit
MLLKLTRARPDNPGGRLVQRKWYPLAAALFIALAALPAFAVASTHSSSARAASRTRAGGGTTLRLAMPDTLPTVDPAFVADEENVQLATLLYSGLVRLDPSYHVVPDAAQRINVSPDHKVYTFYLRPNLRFSNGDPLDADAFAYSIRRSLNPALKSPSAPTYLLDIAGAPAYLAGKAKSVSGIRVISPRVLQITARWPVPYFLLELTYPTSFALDPKSIAKSGPLDGTGWYSDPVSSGPFRLKSWTPNSRIVLTRNPNYYGSAPSVKTITISLAPLQGQGTDLYSYVTHSLDVISLPYYDSGLWKQVGIRETKALSVVGLYLSWTTKPFDNRHVRLALDEALNRPALIAGTLASVVTRFPGYVPPGEAGYDRQLRPLTYDPAKARQELALGGFSGGQRFPPVTIYYGADANSPLAATLIERLAKAIAKAWTNSLKLTVDTRALNFNTLNTRAATNSLPVYISGWTADYPDGHDWLAGQWRTKALNNNVQFSDPAFDRVVEQADVTWSLPAREKLYDQAQQILVKDVAWIPLYIPHRLVYIRPTVTNLVLTGYGLIPRNGSWSQVVVRAAAVQRPLKL